MTLLPVHSRQYLHDTRSLANPVSAELDFSVFQKQRLEGPSSNLFSNDCLKLEAARERLTKEDFLPSIFNLCE